eukprot:1021313-Rhodomonas_salina.1
MLLGSGEKKTKAARDAIGCVMAGTDLAVSSYRVSGTGLVASANPLRTSYALSRDAIGCVMSGTDTA